MTSNNENILKNLCKSNLYPEIGVDINNKFTFSIKNYSVKDGSMGHLGLCGRGLSLDEAIEDFFQQINGRILWTMEEKEILILSV